MNGITDNSLWHTLTVIYTSNTSCSQFCNSWTVRKLQTKEAENSGRLLYVLSVQNKIIIKKERYYILTDTCILRVFRSLLLVLVSLDVA